MDFFKGQNHQLWAFSLEFHKASKLCGQLEYLKLYIHGFHRFLVIEFFNAFCFLKQCPFTEDLFSWKKKHLEPFYKKSGAKKDINSRYLE